VRCGDMRVLEIAPSAEHATADELASALDEAEAAQVEALVALEALKARRAALVGGPRDRDVALLDQELEVKRARFAEVEKAQAEVQRRYRALTRRQPRPRRGGGS
jgi:hypothetical protein